MMPGTVRQFVLSHSDRASRSDTIFEKAYNKVRVNRNHAGANTIQHLKSQNYFHLCPIGTSPEAEMYPETRADMGRSRRPLVTRGEFCDSAV